MSERRPGSPESQVKKIEAFVLLKVDAISALFPESQGARAQRLILDSLVGETVITQARTSLTLDQLLSTLASFLTSSARFISIEILERWLRSGSFRDAPELEQVHPLSTSFSTPPARRQRTLSEIEKGGERFLPRHKKNNPR